MNEPAASGGLHVVDYVVIAVYLAGVLGAGVYFSRQQKEGEDYFVGGRQMPWLAVGLSIIATLLSTVTYLASPGEMILHGPALAIGWLAIPLAFVVVNFLWVPFFMRLGVTSIYEYLETRFGLAARWTAVAMFVFILRLAWMATIVLTASRAVAQITHTSAADILPWAPSPEQWTLTLLFSVGLLATFYTMLGGIKAVIWTDVVQCVILVAGVVLTLVFVAWKTGTGPVTWWQTTIGGGNGHEFPPLASWDITERNTILFTVLAAVFWYGCTFIGDQVAVQRYLTTPSVKAAMKGNIVNFLGDFVTMALLAVCGMALLTYYLDPQFQTQIAEGITDPRNERVADKVFPHFIEHGLPVGVSGLVVAALFAVAMSSLDSGMNSVSAVLTVDVFGRVGPGRSKRQELRLARALTLIVGLVCTAFAWGMLHIPESYNIIGITARTFNCALGPLGAMFVVGMFLPWVGQRAVVIGACCGLSVAIASAWWVELSWLAGVTGHETLNEAVKELDGPSPFLVTPFAATSTFVLSAVLGLFVTDGSERKDEVPTWWVVVRRK